MLNRKALIFSLIVLFMLSISAVSASDNTFNEGTGLNEDIADLNDFSDLNSNFNNGLSSNAVHGLDDDSNNNLSSENMISSSDDEKQDDLEGSDSDSIKDNLNSNSIKDQNNSNSSTADKSNTKIQTKISAKDINTYYKEKSSLVLYLKDNKNQAISNKTIKLSLNGKTYAQLTDKLGKASFSLYGLKPNSYDAKIEFYGDDDYKKSVRTVKVNVKKVDISINTKDFSTYLNSNIFFSVKVLNKLTKSPVEGIRIQFNVYSSQKNYKNYYALSDKDGIATLKKNLKLGSYDVYTYVKDDGQKDYINYRNTKNKVSIKISAPGEMGCSSIYIHVNENESAVAFRRDSTYAADLYIVAQKWHGRNAVKQYKLTGTYFFHAIVTSDGWLVGTGGADNPTINKKIESLAGQMVSSNNIQNSKLNTIRKYERSLGIGHFAIVNPKGNYAIVWKSGYVKGKLKNGQYIDVPNSRGMFRKGSYKSFSKDTATAALRIAATDRFGVNRRDITVFHYKRSTKNYQTSAQVKAYAANDKGNLAGRRTGGKSDNIHYKKTYISRSKLPGTPNKKLLGTHSFGKIDTLIKTQTKVSAPALTANQNQTKYFKVTVRNKKTNKTLSGVKISLKVYTGSKFKSYAVTTNKSGVANFNTKALSAGTHNVTISQANHKYIVSGSSKIVIKTVKKNNTVNSTNSSVVNGSGVNGSSSSNASVNNASEPINNSTTDNSSENNGSAGNSSSSDSSVGNGTASDGYVGNGSSSDSSVGNGTASDGSMGNSSTSDGSAGNGSNSASVLDVSAAINSDSNGGNDSQSNSKTETKLSSMKTDILTSFIKLIN